MKKFMTLALAGAMTAALAVPAFAARDVDYTGIPVTLDGSQGDMLNVSMEYVESASGAALASITLDCTAPFTEAGYVGGGGAIGLNSMNPTNSSEWLQADFAPAEDDGDDFTCVITFDGLVTGENFAWTGEDGAYGWMKICWWWGAGDMLTLNKVTFTYTDGTTRVLGEEASTGDTTDGTTDDDADPTGDTAPVAYLAAIVALAGVALVASKKARA